LPWLVEQAAGKNILDLGAFDETVDSKRNSKYWLHGALAKRAQRVIGIDNSDNLPPNGIQTSVNSGIYRGDIFSLGELVNRYAIDLIVAGELVEHLPNTQAFLQSLKADPVLAGMHLILTTPNAMGMHNLLMGMARREVQHPDHLQLYTLKTLNTLCLRSGFSRWQIRPYHVSFSEMILASSGIKKVMIKSFEWIINLFEKAAPMLSGGWIIDVTI
jgi:hypothetical protein